MKQHNDSTYPQLAEMYNAIIHLGFVVAARKQVRKIKERQKLDRKNRSTAAAGDVYKAIHVLEFGNSS